MPATSPEALERKVAYHMRPEVKERHRLAEEARRRAKGAKPKAQKCVVALKTQSQGWPGHVQLVIAKPKGAKTHATSWAKQVAVIPKGVKVTKCPCFSGQSRFAPPPGFRGEFDREFERLTGKTGSPV